MVLYGKRSILVCWWQCSLIQSGTIFAQTLRLSVFGIAGVLGYDWSWELGRALEEGPDRVVY